MESQTLCNFPKISHFILYVPKTFSQKLCGLPIGFIEQKITDILALQVWLLFIIISQIFIKKMILVSLKRWTKLDTVFAVQKVLKANFSSDMMFHKLSGVQLLYDEGSFELD